jgi:hypothetical protein
VRKWLTNAEDLGHRRPPSAQRVLKAPLDLSSAKIESVLHLRGNVEVRMWSNGRCDSDHGSIVVHADAVAYNDNTNEMRLMHTATCVSSLFGVGAKARSRLVDLYA